MRIGSLFSGYGGLDLAVQQVLGGEVAWHVEYDKAPSRILDHHFPGIPNYGDVTKLDFRSVEPVDVLTGGYPCQPFSHAGLRKGTDDDRHLWPHVLRAIREMGPRLAILENVRGHLSLGFDSVLADLADVGWSARWGVVRASDAGAPHQRARLFIVAYPDESGLPLSQPQPWGEEPGQRDHASVRTLPASQDRGPVADASGERHGRGQDAGMVGRLGATPEVIGRQTSPARSQSGNRGPAATADAASAGRVRTPQHEDDGADSGRGRRHDLADLGKGGGASAAYADLAGSQAWGNAGQDGERIWVEPVGSAQPVAYADESGPQGGESEGRLLMPAWGDYGPAIARWEGVIGRPAPAPTEPGRTGAPRLSPRFVEWMMGLPDGWVTDPAIGISRNDQLKALGNGVVPQQAALALDVLLQGATDDFRQTLATV